MILNKKAVSHSQRPPWLGKDERTWDHVRLHVQLFKDPRIGLHELGVYAALAVHAELTTGAARPSKETLARYLKCSEKNVQRAISTLVETGYISVDYRVGLASVYTLLPPPTLATELGDSSLLTQDSQSPVYIPTQDCESQVVAGPWTVSPDTLDCESPEQEPEQEDTLQDPSKISTLFPTQPLLPAAENELRRREFWKTFIEVCGKPGTPIENKQWNNIAKMFAADPDISPESFKSAHAAAKRTWGANMAKTPTAIAKNWSTLYSAPGADKPRTKETESWMRSKLNWTPQGHPSHPEESA